MVLPELSELKAKRKKLGITQNELAVRTGVSQSLIAKIEAGAIVPSYSNAKRLFDFFESLHNEAQAKAADFMSEKVIGVSRDANLKEAARMMKKHAVSQLPVIEDGRNLGTISEKAILDRMNSAKDMEEVSVLKVGEFMAEAMPTVREDTPFRPISGLLENNPGVLVARKGKVVGIITKSDLLNALIEKK